MIIYAHVTTLYSTLDVFGTYTSENLNLELTEPADWLKLIKLSIKKIKMYDISHAPE